MIDPADIKLGTPAERGRYLAFVRCAPASITEWLEPIIANWTGSKWDSGFIEQDRYMGYYGPIPPMRDRDIGHHQLAALSAQSQVYDL